MHPPFALLSGGGSHFGGFGRPRGSDKGPGDRKPGRRVDGRSSLNRHGRNQNPLGTRGDARATSSTTPSGANDRSLLDILGLGPRGMDVIIPGAPLMAQSLGGAAVIDFGIQLVGWAFAAALKTEKFYDLCGSLAFASTAAMTYASSARLPRQGLITGLVCTWTARLGMFLVRRVFRDGGDSRFDEVKNQPGTFLVYWMLQGAWVWVTALPCFLVNGVASQSALHWGDYVSMALWIVGFITESTADFQKSAFMSDAKNKGRFIDTGLWSVSRHPNYFGEILMWCGVAGVAVSMNASPGISVASCASPLFVTFLLTQMSGIPILEKMADERWGNETAYQEYKRNTPCLIPRLIPPKKQ